LVAFLQTEKMLESARKFSKVILVSSSKNAKNVYNLF